MAIKVLAPLISAGDFPVTEAGFVGVDDERLDDVLAAIQQAQSSVDSQITEMQSQISALGKTIKIKGRVNTVDDLPGTASEGDMYFVGVETAESFDEYVFTAQNKWEHLGSINDVDLSDYVTKSFLSNTLGGYAKLSDIPTVPTNYLTGGSQTSKSTADGGMNVYTFTRSDGTTSTFEVFNGTKGSKGDTGPQGEQGIQGVQGPQGLKGDTGATGATGPKGDTGTAGKDGTNGSNGVSCTHSWSGTTLSVTSASGTSSANLKGEKGDKGDKGDTGPQGPQGQNATTTAVATTSANGLMSATDKEKLDAVNTWTSRDISIPTSVGQYFTTSTGVVTQYYNSTLQKMVVVLKGTTKTQIAANASFNVGSVADNSYNPKARVITVGYISATNFCKIAKSSTSAAITLINDNVAIPSGTNLEIQIEWQIF